MVVPPLRELPEQDPGGMISSRLVPFALPARPPTLQSPPQTGRRIPLAGSQNLASSPVKARAYRHTDRPPQLSSRRSHGALAIPRKDDLKRIHPTPASRRKSSFEELRSQLAIGIRGTDLQRKNSKRGLAATDEWEPNNEIFRSGSSQAIVGNGGDRDPRTAQRFNSTAQSRGIVEVVKPFYGKKD